MEMNRNMIIFHEIGMDNYYKTWHTTGRNMLLYIHSDGGSIVSTEKNHPITKGGLCFIGANKFHYTLPDDPKFYDRSKVFISNEQLESILRLFPEDLKMAAAFSPNSLVCTQLDAEEQRLADRIFAEISEHSEEKYYSEALLLSGYMRLLVCLNRRKNENHSAPADVMQKAVEYINRNIADNISIDDICAAVHISKYHFCRKFKKITGLTVMDYVLETRIVAAKNMLSSEAFPVSEISGKCGFSSISYFCRVFKESTGMSPLQYRRVNT